MPVQGQTIDITMTGKRTGDTMAGMVDFGGLGEAPWTAKRKTEGAAAPPRPRCVGGRAATAARWRRGRSGKWDIVLMTGRPARSR